MGDHIGIPGVVILFSLLLQVDYLSRSIPFFWMVGCSGLWKCSRLVGSLQAVKVGSMTCLVEATSICVCGRVNYECEL